MCVQQTLSSPLDLGEQEVDAAVPAHVSGLEDGLALVEEEQGVVDLCV